MNTFAKDHPTLVKLLEADSVDVWTPQPLPSLSPPPPPSSHPQLPPNLSVTATTTTSNTDFEFDVLTQLLGIDTEMQENGDDISYLNVEALLGCEIGCVDSQKKDNGTDDGGMNSYHEENDTKSSGVVYQTIVSDNKVGNNDHSLYTVHPLNTLITSNNKVVNNDHSYYTVSPNNTPSTEVDDNDLGLLFDWVLDCEAVAETVNINMGTNSSMSNGSTGDQPTVYGSDGDTSLRNMVMDTSTSDLELFENGKFPLPSAFSTINIDDVSIYETPITIDESPTPIDSHLHVSATTTTTTTTTTIDDRTVSWVVPDNVKTIEQLFQWIGVSEGRQTHDEMEH